MLISTKKYQMIKNKLLEKTHKKVIKYLNPKTLSIILNDREKAKEILKLGGNVQEFYKNSETLKTNFYLKNSCDYCELLEILN